MNMIRKCVAGLTVFLCLASLPRVPLLNAFQDPPISPEKDRENPDISPPQTLLVVQGASGKDEYELVFTQASKAIQSAAKEAKARFFWIGRPQNAAVAPTSNTLKTANNSHGNANSKSSVENDRSLLKKLIKDEAVYQSQLWIILIGHGTFDQTTAKFNLRGPDVSAGELGKWLDECKRPIAVINCASASAPFINRLAGKNRVIVTATKSGYELNYTRFAEYFAPAFSNQKADLDKDEQVSLLESFLFASRQTLEFYQSESRLATEHALIDDNGDGKGTPLDFFRGVRVVRKSKDDTLPDGPLANQIFLIKSAFEKQLSPDLRRKRNHIEVELELLRSQKNNLETELYYAAIEEKLVELAKLYRDIQEGSEKSDPAVEKTESAATENSEK